MARIIRGNTVYADEKGAVTTERQRVAKIIFTPNSSGDVLVLSETQDLATRKIKISGAVESVVIDLSNEPIRFESGIFIYEISSGATATLLLSSKGAIS